MRMTFVLAALALLLPSATIAEEGPDYDPWQRMNRGIFWFNDRADHYVVEPVATGWDMIVPTRAERSISNFFANLRFPVVMTNDLLQGKPMAAAVDVSRFMVNTTFGLAGLFDPASIWGLQRHEEDFGQTLGVWGVPPGPYLVLPLLGPSNPRDTAGIPVDYALSITPLVLNGFWWTGAGVVNIVNTRAQVLDQVRQAKQASVDYYVFARNAYYQHRKAQVNDQKEESANAPSDELYDVNGIEGSK